jgi:hypothetical protein
MPISLFHNFLEQDGSGISESTKSKLFPESGGSWRPQCQGQQEYQSVSQIDMLSSALQ